MRMTPHCVQCISNKISLHNATLLVFIPVDFFPLHLANFQLLILHFQLMSHLIFFSWNVTLLIKLQSNFVLVLTVTFHQFHWKVILYFKLQSLLICNACSSRWSVTLHSTRECDSKVTFQQFQLECDFTLYTGM